VFPNEVLVLLPLEVPCPVSPELPPLALEEDKLIPGPPPMILLVLVEIFDGPLLAVEEDIPGLFIEDIVLPLGLEVMLVIPPGSEVMLVIPTGPKENVEVGIP
jgi:hypothetical protein